MKQLIAFSILFCLVFLNVPRSFVHDCEHKIHYTDSHNLESHHQNDGKISFNVNQESCFICEFDLGFFDKVDFKIPSFTAFFNYTFNEPSVQYVSPDEFKAFSHRGPPEA